MPETRREVKTYLINYICDECGDGFMEPTGKMLLTNQPGFPHQCNKCEARETFSDKYPKQVLEYL